MARDTWRVALNAADPRWQPWCTPAAQSMSTNVSSCLKYQTVVVLPYLTSKTENHCLRHSGTCSRSPAGRSGIQGPCSLGVISSIWNSASRLSSLKSLDMSVMRARKGLLGSCWEAADSRQRRSEGMHWARPSLTPTPYCLTLIDCVRNHVPSSSYTLARSMEATSLLQASPVATGLTSRVPCGIAILVTFEQSCKYSNGVSAFGYEIQTCIDPLVHTMFEEEQVELFIICLK